MQLNDDVLPSAVGTGGPVIGVDGLPSNVDHTWNHYPDVSGFPIPCLLLCITLSLFWVTNCHWFELLVKSVIGAQAFSFACNPDILGCETGLEVDPEYAWD